MSEPLAAAISAWETAHTRYEDLLLDEGSPDAFEEAREALFEAELAVKKAWSRLVDDLRRFPETSPLLRGLGEGIEARIRIEEHASLEAERTARHGELAGAGYDERERIGRLEDARTALSALTDAFLDAAVALDDL